MRFQTLAGALALAGSSTAFSDSSPWVLLSSSSFNESPSSKQIQTSSEAFSYTKSFLKTCPTKRYLLVNQPGVTAADLRDSKACAMPSLCRAAEDSQLKAKYIVPEVVGDVTLEGLEEYIADACESKSTDATVGKLDLTSPASDGRAAALSDNDILLSEKLETVTKDGSYTILFISTPGEASYEADFEEPVRMDLKRHVQNGAVRRQNNDTDWEKLPLFEKYQFFTPGIFMGIIVAIILFSILGVGLAALSSLEVSYGAFDKENGPAANKKQQ